MKNYLLNSSNIVALLLAVFCFSCSKEKDLLYTNISGVYSCQETSPQSGYKKYIIEIDKVASQDNAYIISNFHNQGYNEFLFSNLNEDTLFIVNQVIGSLFVNGKGLVNEAFDAIELQYTVDDGFTELDYYALYTR